MTKEQALRRVARIASTRDITLTGDEALALADFYRGNTRAQGVRGYVARAARFCYTRNLKVTGAELLSLAESYAA